MEIDINWSIEALLASIGRGGIDVILGFLVDSCWTGEMMGDREEVLGGERGKGEEGAWPIVNTKN